LQRLGLARIDILYVHDIGAYQRAPAAPQHMKTLREGGYRSLENLKRSGTVGAIGIGVNEREVLLEAMEWSDWDAFLLAGRYRCSNRRRSRTCCRKCVTRGSRSSSAGRSIRAFWPGATPGTMTRQRWRSQPRSANGTASRCRPRPCSFRWPTRPSRRSSGAVRHGGIQANLTLLQHPIPPALWADLRAEKLLHRDAPTPS
jgi:D-threo-aldose 1-dehydrogenase